ncbi:MAG TPA: UvrD-helicase domain-containing protein [Acidimicrobiia bacterium]
MTDPNPELAAEQRYVDGAYRHLDAMREAARRVARGYSDVGRGGTHQARLERDVAEDQTRRRLAALDIGDLPLCFGRIDVQGDLTHYIGRVSVTDEDQDPIVVDWRAPVAEPFYRATAVEPMDVVRRRHFLTRAGEGSVLVGLDDEVFDRDAAAAADLAVIGEGALLAALDRARTGRMADIVATIQAEQDEAIRSALPGILVVTGGAGTGKTAVALHRAAYLLYTHRRRLDAGGVLLIGPNSIFLRYIDQVLPSLGEDDVQLATPTSLKPQYTVRAEDSPDVARVKGDPRMATVISNALQTREHPLPRDLVLTVDGEVLRLRRTTSKRIVERARRRRGSHNEKRPRVARAVVEHLREQYRRALGVAAPDDADWDRELDARLRRLPDVRAALDRMWPVLSGGELVNDLFSFPALVRSAADGVLSRDEQRGLVRPRAADLRDVAWTEADLALIDEADALLGAPARARPRRARRRRTGADDTGARVVTELGVGGFLTAADVARRYNGDGAGAADESDEPRTFAHVLVDEAQDLSAMQWRMLARRCPSRSMTLVGDFGQASRPAAPRGWESVLEQLTRDQAWSDRAAPRTVTLTVNYRTPAEIMGVAHRLLAAAAPGIEPTRAVRRTGEPPRFDEVEPVELVRAAASAARAAADDEGTVAIVAPSWMHDDLVAALADVGAVADSADALDAPVAVLDALGVKGLEFDHVVVVEPAALVTGDERGLRLLYVVLTRATHRLVVVHADPLPEALDGATAPTGAPVAAT